MIIGHKEEREMLFASGDLSLRFHFRFKDLIGYDGLGVILDHLLLLLLLWFVALLLLMVLVMKR